MRSGGNAPYDVEWFLSVTETHLLSYWLAIQFSETDRALAFASGVLDDGAVEGCCLYAAGRFASTRIEYFSFDLVLRFPST